MNLLEVCTKKEIELIENAGIEVENKNYNADELKLFESKIESYIMSHSTKNGEIDKLSNKYRSIIRTFDMENEDNNKKT